VSTRGALTPADFALRNTTAAGLAQVRAEHQFTRAAVEYTGPV